MISSGNKVYETEIPELLAGGNPAMAEDKGSWALATAQLEDSAMSELDNKWCGT
mgnify:CR=1 FL=1